MCPCPVSGTGAVSLFCSVQGSINDRFVKIVIINNFGCSPGDADEDDEEDQHCS